MRLRVQGLCAGLLLAGLCVSGADPVELQDRLQLADGLFRRSLFELAAREYAALAETPAVPGLDDVLFRLGECYRRMKRAAEAEAAYKRLIEALEDAELPRTQVAIADFLGIHQSAVAKWKSSESFPTYENARKL